MRQLTSEKYVPGYVKISKLPMRQLTLYIDGIKHDVFSKLPMRQLTYDIHKL